jgi:effector-binding domain-containing protein
MQGRSSDSRKRLRTAAILSLVALLAATAVAITFGGPKYQVIDSVGEVEIREYEPYLVAETAVDGDLETAGNRGFRILAKYIFGDNQGKRRIAMTTPVSQEQVRGTKIAMTAPVTQEKAGDTYVLQFMMPSEYSRAELPEPNDSRITIREIPARSFAAVRYSGTWSKRNYEKHLEQLLDTLKTEGYAPVGDPIWARYDPPFMPWFLRRNEILTEFRVMGSNS